jgi:hypothetical protein
MDGQKIIIMMMCFSVVLYVLGFQLVDGDLMDKIYDTSNLDLNADSTSINFDSQVQEKFPKQVENSNALGLNYGTFIDGLSLIWSLVLLIFNLLTSPIAIFSFLPPIISILLGIPLSFMYLLAIIKFVRGADF